VHIKYGTDVAINSANLGYFVSLYTILNQSEFSIE